MSSTGVNILLVDDETHIRENLADYLEDYDYRVQQASNAEDAEKLMLKGEFDLAVVDLRLPGQSGDSLILKAHDKASHMKFLIYTGSVDYMLTEDLRKLGIRPEHVLHKPLSDLSELKAAIESLLDD